MWRCLQFAMVGVLASGCAATTVTPVVTGGHLARGTVTLTYWHRTRHIVDWSAAEQDAMRRCQAWGYETADLFPVSSRTCVQSNDHGCLKYRSELEAQCVVVPVGESETRY
ncbi:MAG: YecR family lipoprotein [Myxococcota bacterium]